MTIVDRPCDTQLVGQPMPARFAAFEEVVRPFTTSSRGITFTDELAGRKVSYRDLANLAAAGAARLRRWGVGPNSLVAMTVTNDLASIIALLSIWACGATVVSLPPVPRRASEWYSRQFGPTLDRMGCGFLIEGDDGAPGAFGGDQLRKMPRQALADSSGGRVADPETAAPDIALIQFTSGSVGSPKGVAIASTALASHLAAIISTLRFDGEADRIASWLPLYHDMGLILMFGLALATRADVVLAQPSTFATWPASWLTMLSQHRATVTAAPDFGYRLTATVPYPDGLDLSSVRVALSGAERLHWQTLVDFQATAEPMGLHWEAICPSYGLAEATVGVTHTPLGRGPLQGPGGHVSVGGPAPGVALTAPAGEAPGPIRVRGASLFSGYHTDRGFEPLAHGEWFDTGDAGFVHDGELYVLGRRDEVLTVAGRNVFAEDVESVAQDACGQRIGACAAFRNLTATGRFALLAEANPRVVKGQAAVGELAHLLQSAVVRTLGTRPTPVLVARLGVIPRTTSGKVRRAQCRLLYDNGEFGRGLLAELT
jgi:acyl-CoA synthetase (AMP-forming)/AMP-acid ligase II